MSLPDFYLILFSALALGQIGLAIFLWKSEKEFIAELARTIGLPQQQKQSWSLWHQSLKKAQSVLGQAELEGVKVVADSKFYTAKLEGVYEDQMRQATARMEKEFGKVLSAAQSDFGRSLSGLELQSARIVDDAIVTFTKRLEEKLTEVESTMLKLAMDEAKTAKAEVAAYRTMMMETTKKEIGGILEEVGKEVLGKKLSFSDQADLINEALEQANNEKFIT